MNYSPSLRSKYKPIYLICGAPGSGKSWVINQVKDKFTHVNHDSIMTDAFTHHLEHAARTSDKPIIADVPFRTSTVIDELDRKGYKVYALYIVENEKTVKDRHMKRGTEFKAYHSHRVNAMYERAKTHANFSGTSEQVLNKIKEMV